MDPNYPDLTLAQVWYKETLGHVILGSAEGGQAAYLQVDYMGNGYLEGGDPVSEPATMLLLGSGLIGLAGARRKLKKIVGCKFSSKKAGYLICSAFFILYFVIIFMLIRCTIPGTNLACKQLQERCRLDREIINSKVLLSAMEA